jgi:hypothetical protein
VKSVCSRLLALAKDKGRRKGGKREQTSKLKRSTHPELSLYCACADWPAAATLSYFSLLIYDRYGLSSRSRIFLVAGPPVTERVANVRRDGTGEEDSYGTREAGARQERRCNGAGHSDRRYGFPRLQDPAYLVHR